MTDVGIGNSCDGGWAEIDDLAPKNYCGSYFVEPVFGHNHICDGEPVKTYICPGGNDPGCKYVWRCQNGNRCAEA
jgi:hypothetical protein